MRTVISARGIASPWRMGSRSDTTRHRIASDGAQLPGGRVVRVLRTASPRKRIAPWKRPQYTHRLRWAASRSSDRSCACAPTSSSIALFRAGNDDAFGVIHDRYRQRLFAYVRQMLSAGSRQDAEDVLQDVFVRAFAALRADRREVNLRAWLYRVAHNRCIDHLRRPTRPDREIFEVSRKPLHDPVDEAERRERPAPPRRRRRPAARPAALRPAHARDGRHVLRRPGRRARRHGARGQVAARARPHRPRRGRRGARHRLQRDPPRPAGRLRPRREGLRPRAPAHARVRRLPRVPHRPARDAALLRGPLARRRRRAARGRRQAARPGRRGRRGGGGRRRRRGRRRRGAAAGWRPRRPARSPPWCAARRSTAGGAVEVRQLARRARPAGALAVERGLPRAGAPEPASAAAAAAAAVRAAPPAAAAASAPAAAADVPRAGDARRRADATEAERSRRRARERRRAPAAAVPEEAAATAPATELPADAELPPWTRRPPPSRWTAAGSRRPRTGSRPGPRRPRGPSPLLRLLRRRPRPPRPPRRRSRRPPAGRAPGAETGGTAPPG